MILSIFTRLEGFLLKLGGLEYCRSIGEREINSVDILIYSAYEAEKSTLHSNILGKYPLMSLHVKEIEEMIENNIAIKNKLALLPPGTNLSPRM
jgi:hypothetical protein